MSVYVIIIVYDSNCKEIRKCLFFATSSCFSFFMIHYRFIGLKFAAGSYNPIIIECMTEVSIWPRNCMTTVCIFYMAQIKAKGKESSNQEKGKSGQAKLPSLARKKVGQLTWSAS